MYRDGDACDLSGCHPACAVGCTRTNDITACTTKFYGSRWRNCGRCKKGYHVPNENSGNHEGCARGKPDPDSCGATTSPSPTPCPGFPTTQCGDRRLRDLVAFASPESDAAADNTVAVSDAHHGRALPPAFWYRCGCDGKSVVFFIGAVDACVQCTLPACPAVPGQSSGSWGTPFEAGCPGTARGDPRA